jgi:hypothetical protein
MYTPLALSVPLTTYVALKRMCSIASEKKPLAPSVNIISQLFVLLPALSLCHE